MTLEESIGVIDSFEGLTVSASDDTASLGQDQTSGADIPNVHTSLEVGVSLA